MFDGKNHYLITFMYCLFFVKMSIKYDITSYRSSLCERAVREVVCVISVNLTKQLHLRRADSLDAHRCSKIDWAVEKAGL